MSLCRYRSPITSNQDQKPAEKAEFSDQRKFRNLLRKDSGLLSEQKVAKLVPFGVFTLS